MRAASIGDWVARLAVGVALVAGLGACGSASGDGVVAESPAASVAAAATSTTASQPSFGALPWRDARRGDARDEVILGFIGPDPAGGRSCAESYRAATTPLDTGAVTVMIEVSTPRADPACPTTRLELSVRIDGLRQGSVLHAGLTGYRYRLAGERFDLLAESTPCGRTDCSTPSPTPALCDTEAVHAAIARGIDGGIRVVSSVKCDGSFLVVPIDTGSGGCAPAEGGPSPCAKSKTAYFVARAGSWSIVSYGPDMSCVELEAASAIRFPPELCA